MAHSCVHACRPEDADGGGVRAGERVDGGPAEGAGAVLAQRRAHRDAGQLAAGLGVHGDDLLPAEVRVVGPVPVPPPGQPPGGERQDAGVYPGRGVQLAAVGGEQRLPHRFHGGDRVEPGDHGVVVEHNGHVRHPAG